MLLERTVRHQGDLISCVHARGARFWLFAALLGRAQSARFWLVSGLRGHMLRPSLCCEVLMCHMHVQNVKWEGTACMWTLFALCSAAGLRYSSQVSLHSVSRLRGPRAGRTARAFLIECCLKVWPLTDHADAAVPAVLGRTPLSCSFLRILRRSGHTAGIMLCSDNLKADAE